MNDFLGALRQGLDLYEIIPITKENYADVWEVYTTNQKYLQSWDLGKVVEVCDILEIFTRLPDYYDKDKQLFFGIWYNGQVLAVCDLLPQLDGDDNLWLSGIIVHGDKKGMGLGKIITKAIVEAAQKAGFSKITLGTCQDTAAPFWLKMGFVHTQTFDDTLIFVRRLDEKAN